MMQIRLAREEDAEALVNIYRPYVEKTAVTFEYEVPTAEEFARRIREFSAFYPYFAVEENGELLGYAYAHRFAARKAYDWVCETSIYIREDARGRGAGRLLYEKLLDALRRMGIFQTFAVISLPNEPSVAFHRKMGFAEGMELPDTGWKLNGWHGTKYMIYRLRDEKECPEPVISFRNLA